MSYLAAVFLAGAISMEGARAEEQGEAEQVLREVVERYRSVRSLRARFIRTSYSRAGGNDAESRGTIVVDRARGFRIDFDRPAGAVWTGDANVIRAFDPQSGGRLIEFHPAPEFRPLYLRALEDPRSLLGMVDVRIVRVQRTTYAGTVLELRPAAPEPGAESSVLDPFLDRLMLYVDRREPTRGEIHRLMWVDPAGNTERLALEQLRYDVRMPDAFWTFVPPSGTRVVEL